MYIPETEAQLAFTDLQIDSNVAQSIPNVTKEISDILKMCDAAGLEPHGLGCGMSIAFVLTLAAALLVAVFVVLIPAIASTPPKSSERKGRDKILIVGLVVGVFTVIGTVIAAFVAGVTAAFITIVAGITNLVAIVSRTIVKIVSLPFRPCLRNQDPISPLDNSEAGGVVNGQIHYSRQEEGIARPPSYHSDEESPQINQSGK